MDRDSKIFVRKPIAPDTLTSHHTQTLISHDHFDTILLCTPQHADQQIEVGLNGAYVVLNDSQPARGILMLHVQQNGSIRRTCGFHLVV